MDGKYVFISYKAEEYDQALWVKRSLEEGGIPCWMAPMSIRGGLSYAQEIPPAIRDSSVFVLLLSQKAQESKWVPRELDQAINCNKVIMPFMLEDCPLRSDFSFYLTNVQRYDAFRDMEGTMQRMTQDIQKVLGITPPPKVETPVPVEQPPAEPEVAPAHPKPQKVKKPAGKKPAGKKRLLWILGAVALALVVVILLCLPRSLTIGGVTFEVDDYTIRIEDATLTVADLAKFSKFENLSVIRLERCNIQTWSLAPMISDDLTTLELVDCGITDHQFASIDFTVMRRFTDLNVSGNPDLTDISSVSVCAGNLTRLEISDTGIRSFDWLKQLTKLEVFRADRTGLADISVLEAMIYLEELSLSGNGINSLKGLKNTSKLSVVDLSDNYLTDVLVLGRSVANLSVLHLENNCLSDLNCLSGASQLRKVYVDGNTLADLDWLKASRDLRILSASHNCIESISGLGIGNKMRYLNLADNWLTSIARGDLAFEENSYLMVDLSNNRLTELELPENCTYRHLAILGNPELDLRNLSKLKGWNLYFDFPVDVSLQTLKNLPFTNLCMVGCPLDRQVEIEEGLYTEELMTLEDALAEIAEQAKEADY